MADMSPADWLALLNARLDERWARMRLFDDYYEGRHQLAFATDKFREAFGSLFGTFADNWAPLIVSSSVERLRVQGFRFGDASDADQDAWAVWQENGLDAEATMAHTESVKLGEAYWLVEPPKAGQPPRITSEHPSQAIVACAPNDRRNRLAALKKWDGDDGYVYANIYLPDGVVKYRAKANKDKSNVKLDFTQIDAGSNPLGVVPMIPLRNNPSMLYGGQSDLQPAVPLFDAINKLASDMVVASEYAAFRQRVMTGVEVPKDPLTGLPLNVDLQMGITRLITVEAPDAKVFDLAASDLNNYVNAIEMFVQHLAAQTRTPPHYLIGRIVNASGDALKAAEAGLTSKCRDKMVTFGEGHEEAMRLALKSMGKTVAGDSETIWADPESRSFGELVDGLVKLSTINVPRRALWEMAQFSPQEIARFDQMRAEDQLLALLNAPIATPSTGQPGAVEASAQLPTG